MYWLQRKLYDKNDMQFRIQAVAHTSRHSGVQTVYMFVGIATYSDVRIALLIKIQLLLFMIAAFSFTNAMADHPGVTFGADSSGPINTISSIPLAKGQWVFGMRSDITNFDAFSNNELEGFAARGIEGAHSVDKLSSTSVAIGHGVSDNLTIGLRLPYVKRDNIREGELDGGVPEVHSHSDTSGIGDAVVLGQYRFMKKDTLSTSLLLGIKAPTGKTNVKDSGGARQETEFQPGTGSWDLLLGLAMSKQARRIGYHANILYQRTTEGSQDTEIGDVLFYNAALSYRLSRSKHGHDTHDKNSTHKHSAWDLLLEINAEDRKKNKILGAKEANSGGTIIYLSPGIRFSSASGWGGFLSIGIPVSERLNGKQTDINYRITGGFAVAF